MNAESTSSSTPWLFRLHPAFLSFAAEFRAVSVRLLAYACGIGTLALVAADVGTRLIGEAPETPVLHQTAGAWTSVPRPQPAFSAPVAEFSAQSEAYEIQRHPEGGRKDILRWFAADGRDIPLSQIELYRPGLETASFAIPLAELSTRVKPLGASNIQTAGVIETKFGPVALIGFSLPTAGKAGTCMGFAHSFETPRLQVSGWSCQGENAQMQRQVIACSLDRLTMLSAGNDPKLAELFARAELKRAGCAHLTPPGMDWVTTTKEPVLRGSFTLARN